MFIAGEACGRILIVRSGQIKVYRTAASGREQILEILGSGDTCACNPGVSNWSCTSSSEAITDGSVWILARERYAQLAKNNVHFSQTLNQLFAHRLCHLSSLIEEVSLKDVKKRLIKFLVDMLDSKPVAAAGTVPISLSREDIARRLGTARETIARHLHEFKRLKLIDIKPQQIIIRNKEGLQKLLEA